MNNNKKGGLLGPVCLLVTGAALCFSVSCQGTDSAATRNDEEVIAAMSNARARAFAAGDAAAIAVHFTDDANLMAPDQPILQGKNAVQAYYQSIFDEYETELESYYDEVEVSGNLAYGRGYAKVTLYPIAGGDSLVSTAKYLNILKKQVDGTWKTTHDVWNSN